MKKGTFIAILALLTAMVGTIIALAAYFNRKKCVVCDDLDDELLYDDGDDIEYYAAQIHQAEEACCDCEPHEAPAAEEVEPAADTENDDPDEGTEK